MAVWWRWITVLAILAMFAAHQCGSQWTLGAQLRSESGHLAIKGGIFLVLVSLELELDLLDWCEVQRTSYIPNKYSPIVLYQVSNLRGRHREEKHQQLTAPQLDEQNHPESIET